MTTTDISPESGLLSQLASDKRSVVIGAIVQLAKVGNSQEALLRLRKLADSSDREVSFFAAQAIAKIQARLGQSVPPPAESSRSSTLTSDNLVGLDRTSFFAPLKSEIPRLLKLVREQRQQIPEDLKPAVAYFLSKYGGEEDIPWLVEQIKANDSNLALPFIEALEALSPSALQPLLPDLLASIHPLVRGRAITALRRIDPEEAEAHLAELLASRKQEDRLAGLSIAFLFPFDKVKELVFAILREETDLEVLKGCGTLLASNPDVDCALRLLDLIDTSDKTRIAPLTSIFKALCQTLGATGLLPASEAAPEAMLARWKRERLKKFLADLEVEMPLATPPRRDAMLAWLSKNMDNAEVRATVERLALNPATEELARRLLQSHAKQKQLAALATSPGRYSDDDKRQFLHALDEEGFKLWADWVKQEARNGNPIVREAALNTLARFDSSAESLSIAEQALQEGEPAIQAAAARLIEKIDVRRLLPHLSILLTSNDARLRARGIKIARQHDEAAALQTLAAMLASPDPATRANAVGSLFLFPVEKVSGLLLKTLEKEDHAAIARQILVVLLSNPSVDLLDRLDHVHARANPSVSLMIAQARIDLFDLILQLGLDEQATGAVRKKPGQSSRASVPSSSGHTDGAKSAVATKDAAPALSGTSGSLESSRGKCEEAASQASYTKQTAESTTADKTTDNASEKAAASKPYAVSQVRAVMRSRQTAKRDEALAHEKAKTSEWKTYLLVVVAIVFLAFVPSMFLSLVTPPEKDSFQTGPKAFDPRKSDAESIHNLSIPDGFHMNQMGRITARVKEIRPDGLVSVQYGSQTFLLEGIASIPMLLGGEEVEIEFLPYQKFKDGSILAECHNFKVRY